MQSHYKQLSEKSYKQSIDGEGPKIIKRKTSKEKSLFKKKKDNQVINLKEQATPSNNTGAFLSAKYTKMKPQDQWKTLSQIRALDSEKTTENGQTTISMKEIQALPIRDLCLHKKSRSQHFKIQEIFPTKREEKFTQNYINTLQQTIQKLWEQKTQLQKFSKNAAVQRSHSQQNIVKSLLGSQREGQKGSYKNQCAQCRYHLLKEKQWYKEKQNLVNLIKKMKEKQSYRAQLGQNDLPVDSSSENSTEQLETLKESLKQKQAKIFLMESQIQSLTTYINQNQTYFNELKKKNDSLNDQLKYVNIENRTLLKNKSKMLEKQIQNVKLREERDSFKRKAIQNYKRIIELEKLLRKGSQPSEPSQSSFSELSRDSTLELLTLSDDVKLLQSQGYTCKQQSTIYNK